MTREETQKILAAIQTAYPGYKVEDKKYAVDLWTEMLSDLTYEQVSIALRYFISTDTKGFAPSIGQLRAKANVGQQESMITDSEAWDMVYNALCNSNYHAEEEYNKLPTDVRHAVGGASTLRAWAAMDESAITVAESNFKRTYRAIYNKRQQEGMLPMNMRPQIEEAPLARIPDKETREEVESASNEFVDSLLAEYREKWAEEMR